MVYLQVEKGRGVLHTGWLVTVLYSRCAVLCLLADLLLLIEDCCGVTRREKGQNKGGGGGRGGRGGAPRLTSLA